MSQKLEYELKGKSDVEQVTGRAKKSVETLGQSFKKAGDDIVKKLTGMFAGAVLFDKALNFLVSTFSDLDKMADQVDRSGLSAEKFQQLAWAAKMTGVEMSVLAKATRQLRVDMAEAAAGTGKKLALFKALGITMEQLKSGDATAVFLALAKSMQGTADDSEKLIISTALFGDKVGNDIMPMLADFQKLNKDIGDAPIVDEKTLKAIGEYNDQMDRLNASLVRLAAGFVSVYQSYSKWAEKVAEDVATGMFDFLDKVGPRGAAASLTTTAIKSTGMGGALVVMGADGSTRPTGSAAPAAGAAGSNTAAVLAAAKAGGKDEKEKSADTKGQTGGNAATSVSGNVIGVGQNPVISAIQDQTEIAKQSMTYLEMIAHNFGPQNKFRDITEKGGTPITPASR
jgi:hypothetical protein